MISLHPRLNVGDELVRLAQLYKDASPFQHVVIDNVFSDRVLDAVLADFNQLRHNSDYADNTTQGKSTCDDWDQFPPATFELISFLNAGPFVSFLAKVTDIPGLTSDPYLLGGGVHETLPGGYLKMHTDFNFHKVLRLDRRINAILFLNRDWHRSWGGELVLSDAAMAKTLMIAPIFNRLVIFNTNDHSFHGQPDPHSFPQGTSRKSIAMYYYTNGRPAHETISQKIGTTYKARHRGDFPFVERLKEVGRLFVGSKRMR